MTPAEQRALAASVPILLTQGERVMPVSFEEILEPVAAQVARLLAEAPADAAAFVREQTDGSIVVETWALADLAKLCARAGYARDARRLASPPPGANRWLIIQDAEGWAVTLHARPVVLAAGGSA
jgi:hypothetical protein